MIHTYKAENHLEQSLFSFHSKNNNKYYENYPVIFVIAYGAKPKSIIV